MYSFEVDKPDSVDAAVSALAVEDAQALGGGQTLIPTLKQRLASPSRLVSLAGIAAMKGVSSADGVVTKPSGTVSHDLEERVGDELRRVMRSLVEAA